DLAPVLLLEAIVVAPNGAQHRRPWLLDHEKTAALGDRLAVLRDDVGDDAEEGKAGRSRLRVSSAEQRGHHDGARFRLPPGVDDGAAAAADGLVVPDPRFGVDRLADRSQEPQAREVALLRPLVPPADEGADGRRRRVEDGDLEPLDHAPE